MFLSGVFDCPPRSHQAAVKKNEMHTALTLLRRLFDAGLSPDVRLYNTLSKWMML
jgi:hypothetical protein